MYAFLSLSMPILRLAARLIRRIDIRIVPASMVIYLLCSLDRSNIVSFECSCIPPNAPQFWFVGQRQDLKQGRGRLARTDTSYD